jgi:hypothetical protein
MPCRKKHVTGLRVTAAAVASIIGSYLRERLQQMAVAGPVFLDYRRWHSLPITRLVASTPMVLLCIPMIVAVPEIAVLGNPGAFSFRNSYRRSSTRPAVARIRRYAAGALSIMSSG